MGTSESFTCLENSTELSKFLTELKKGSDICRGTAFSAKIHYLLNSTVQSGSLLKSLCRLSGQEDADRFFQTMNDILEQKPPSKAFPILAGGDPVTGLGRFGLSFLNMPPDAGLPELLHAVYLYQACMAKLNIETLQRLSGTEALLIAGGGGTANKLAMRYRAAVLGKPVYRAPLAELPAMGAALCAANAAGDAEPGRSLAARCTFSPVEPDFPGAASVRAQADELEAFYREAGKKTILEIMS
jgi:sugar (pentulose or hexulose) kinase